jgi:hypothetical protein
MQPSFTSRRSPLASLPSGLVLALGFLLAGFGCKSLTEPGSASFASATIPNRTPAEIAEATIEVFAADGYRRGPATPAGEMTFEKETSRATTMAREGVLATHYGAQTINVVRVQIVPLTENSHRLQCQAFMVKGGSDPFFQDQVPLSHARRGPYQALLDKVKQRLQ